VSPAQHDQLTRGHLVAHVRAVMELEVQAELLECWGERLGADLLGGRRLLVAGNGGSAAQAQHLTGELVGRYRTERPALSAIALLTDAASLTAVANDYGWEDVFARQVRAHGRPGDVLLLLSTSGESANLLLAAASARSLGLRVWALTGPEPNSLARASDEAIAVSGSTAVVQEAHLVAIHLLCAAVDSAVSDRTGIDGGGVGDRLDLPREAAAG
jgi:D-sedoheptulose 7-phosphate isomerase